MAIITFDAAIFRAEIHEYSDPALYPDVLLQAYWDMAILYISNENTGYLVDEGRRLAINYMVAHLIYLNNLIAQGTTPGIVTASTVDRTSVTLQAPPGKTAFKFWLNQSPRGQALLALLSANSVGGFFVGSNFPRGGIRQPAGYFL